MTRTTLPKTCSTCSRKLNSSNRASALGFGIGNDFADTCMSCYDAFGLENEHTDQGHDEIVEGCPMCDAYALVKDESKAHAPQTRSSHAECAHESTKAARAKCRRQRSVKHVYATIIDSGNFVEVIEQADEFCTIRHNESRKQYKIKTAYLNFL